MTVVKDPLIRATAGERSSNDANVGQSEPECEESESSTKSTKTEESVSKSTEEDARRRVSGNLATGYSFRGINASV
jgi:hypothetical protein